MKLKHLAIIIVWVIIFIGDGAVLPALTGLPSGFGIMVLLSAMVVVFGVQRWVIGLGIILAGLTELMVGTYFGTVIGAWLAIVWTWHFLNNFFNIKTINENSSFVALVPCTLFGLGLFGLGEGVLWVISRLVYEPGLSIVTLFDVFHSSAILSIVVIEFVMILFVFRLIYSSRNDQRLLY